MITDKQINTTCIVLFSFIFVLVGSNIIKTERHMKSIGILFASFMFIWSGVNKINNFDKKVGTLMNKTELPKSISSFGMILVILLEIIGFIILLDYYFGANMILYKEKYRILNNEITRKEIINIILILLLLFLIVVTLIYHPFDYTRPIPFFSNVTTFGLFMYVLADLKSFNKGLL